MHGSKKAREWSSLWFMAALPLLLLLSFMFVVSIFLALDVASSGLSRISFPTWPQANASAADDQNLVRPVDPHCLSRAQQDLFRPIEHRNVTLSAPFEEAWRKYGELHKLCTVGKNLSAVLLSREQSGCKYLVYLESPAGLGNRLLSLITAFTYALLTDRVLLLDQRKNLGALLCEPFAESSWLLPEGFPYEEIERLSLGGAIKQNFSDGFVRFNLNHVRNRDDEKFFCEDEQQLIQSKARWVGWSSNQYYVTELFMMPVFWERLDSMFPNATGVITHLSRLLILPANDIWGLIVRHYWGYLAGAVSRAGVQIRLHGHKDLASFDLLADQKILECLVSNRILPTIRDSDEAAGHAPVDVAVLVTSLQGEYARSLRRRYSQHATEDGRVIRVHTASELARQANSEEEIRMALAEMWLLSFSDRLATSAYSTFGYVAQGLGGLRPYILNVRKEKEGNETVRPACTLGQSVEPCTHYPVKLQCVRPYSLSPQHKAWLLAHVRPCQDQDGGWQLVQAAAHELPSLLPFFSSYS